MNEELMRNDEIEVVEEPEEVTDGRSGMPTGLAMLIGSGLTLAIVAGVKKAKKVFDKHKAKKEQPVMVVPNDEDEIVDEEEESN